MILKFKLFENQSLSIDVMEWTDFIYGVIVRHGIPIFMKSTLANDLHTTVEIDGDDWDVETGIVHLTGPKFDNLIKRHISKDNELKIKNFQFELNLTFMPDEIWSLDYFNGYFTDDEADMVDDYLENPKLYLDIYIPNSILIEAKPTLKDVDRFLKDYSIRAKIYEIVSHEMDHCFEFTQRREHNANIFPERLLNFLISINKEYKFANVSPDWLNFLRLCYLNLSFEQNARVTQIFHSLVDTEIEDVKHFWEEIKSTDVWKELIELRDFDAKEFYENMSLNASDEDIKETFVNGGFFTKEEVEDYDAKYLVLKHLISYWNETIDEVNKEFEKRGDVKLEKLPQSLLNEPMKFLKYFENKFHRSWKKFYRKISKFAPILINKEFPTDID